MKILMMSGIYCGSVKIRYLSQVGESLEDFREKHNLRKNAVVKFLLEGECRFSTEVRSITAVAGLGTLH